MRAPCIWEELETWVGGVTPKALGEGENRELWEQMLETGTILTSAQKGTVLFSKKMFIVQWYF